MEVAHKMKEREDRSRIIFKPKILDTKRRGKALNISKRKQSPQHSTEIYIPKQKNDHRESSQERYSTSSSPILNKEPHISPNEKIDTEYCTSRGEPLILYTDYQLLETTLLDRIEKYKNLESQNIQKLADSNHLIIQLQSDIDELQHAFDETSERLENMESIVNKERQEFNELTDAYIHIQKRLQSQKAHSSQCELILQEEREKYKALEQSHKTLESNYGAQSKKFAHQIRKMKHLNSILDEYEDDRDCVNAILMDVVADMDKQQKKENQTRDGMNACAEYFKEALDALRETYESLRNEVEASQRSASF